MALDHTHLFDGVYANRRVMVTGHTGFKGSWLSIWLAALGADVIGVALDPPSDESFYKAADLGRILTEDHRVDIRDSAQLAQVVESSQPDLIIHLAAQSIVLESYKDPLATYQTNTTGTIHLLDAIRQAGRPTSMVCITTDKVYANQEWVWGYRENDRLGGHDPYAASKAMAELAVDSYRASYFPVERVDEHGVLIASARAGNVIGGGDFAAYRLVPDCMRALMDNQPIGIRNPNYVRPWQLVLEPLSGYLGLGAKLMQRDTRYASSWNFGPLEQVGVTTAQLAEKLIALWGAGSWEDLSGGKVAPEETRRLRISWEKAAADLGWRPVYTWEEAAAEIVAWFKAFENQEDMLEVGRDHIEAFVAQAQTVGLTWAG